jgi:hypothetical protein
MHTLAHFGPAVLDADFIPVNDFDDNIREVGHTVANATVFNGTGQSGKWMPVKLIFKGVEAGPDSDAFHRVAGSSCEAVRKGLGYALSENLPMENGQLLSSKMKDLGILRAHETPCIEVTGVEVADPVGPYGAKGLGEIGLVPTAAAVANAFCAYDGIRRTALPLHPPKPRQTP